MVEITIRDFEDMIVGGKFETSEDLYEFMKKNNIKKETLDKIALNRSVRKVNEMAHDGKDHEDDEYDEAGMLDYSFLPPSKKNICKK